MYTGSVNNDDGDDDNDDSFGEFEQPTAGINDVEDGEMDDLDLALAGDDADALLAAILGDDDRGNDGPSENDLDRMEMMMRRLLAAREAGQDMGGGQRRRMAARAVADVMREL